MINEKRRERRARDPERVNAVRRKWLAREPERVDRYRLTERLKRHGLTVDGYDQLLSAQGGACAICKTPKAKSGRQGLFIDHDHEKGRVRGLLCHYCNSAIGLLREKPEVFTAAISYLRTAK